MPEALDAQELRHLAGQAIDEDDHERALVMLKRLLAIDPDDVKALCMLAAVHAEIGMYDRAITEMTGALEAEPDMPYARFQLGLMLLMQNRVEEGLVVWTPLRELEAAEPLWLLERGLRAYLNDDYAECVANLEAGIAADPDDETLNSFVVGVLEDARASLAAAGEPQETPEPASPSAGRVLSAYRDGSEPGETPDA